jgi:hypothetical protein
MKIRTKEAHGIISTAAHFPLLGIFSPEQLERLQACCASEGGMVDRSWFVG